MTFPIQCSSCFGTGKVYGTHVSPGVWQSCASCDGEGKHRPVLRSAALVDAERFRWLIREHKRGRPVLGFLNNLELMDAEIASSTNAAVSEE